MSRRKPIPPAVPEVLSPAEHEERVQKARAADQRIKELLASMQGAKGSMIETSAKSLDVANEGDTNRLIWHGIVKYANANLGTAEGRGTAFLAFQAFSTLFLIRERNPLEGDIKELTFRDLERRTSGEGRGVFGDFFDACCERLSEHHSRFRTMLSWLADPNGLPASQKRDAIEFLLEHGEADAIEFDLEPNDDFDDAGNSGAPFYYFKYPRAYRTVLSPVASFILGQIERYQTDRMADRLSLHEAIPVMVCKRPSCGRFAVV